MKRRIMMFLLSFVMVVGLIPVYAIDTGSASSGSSSVQTVSVDLPQNEKAELSAGVEGADSLQWQIRASESPDVWVDIYGQTEESCELSYAMIASLLDDGNNAYIRCMAETSDLTTIGSSYTVHVTDSADQKSAAETLASSGTRMMARAKAFAAENTPLTEADGGVVANNAPAGTYTVEIEYQFENGEQAANPYTATVAAGTALHVDVTSPTVVGYTASQEVVTIAEDAVNEDITKIVIYEPAEVSYTVKHYHQNVDNDEYTLADTETKTGYTGDNVAEALSKSYDGFYALLYDPEIKIAADGSTEVEIYYDRYYYLMNFQLDGGYGVDPVYARYGTPISVGTPTKAGHTFTGWTTASGAAASVPSTMPAENTTFKASWKAADTAKVTVIVWGQNAEDDEYSYMDSREIDAVVGSSISWNDSVCGQEEHTHNASCGYNCGQEEHTHNVANCGYGCGQTEHAHTYDCYPGASSQAVNRRWISGSSGAGEGAVRDVRGESYNAIYINGQWYRYRGTVSVGETATANCGKTVHTHSIASCGYGCGKTAHTHSSSCGYACGKTEHTHSAACTVNGNFEVNSTRWTFKSSETVTVAADGTTVLNVYFDRTTFTFTFRNRNRTIHSFTERWGKDISGKWRFTGTDGISYPQTNPVTSWDPSGSTTITERITMVRVMPAENITFTHTTTSNTARNFYYYVQSLNGETGDRTFQGKQYDLYLNLPNDFNRIYYNEDFFEIDGFTRERAATENGTAVTISNNGTGWQSGWNSKLYFYYTRNSYDLTFFNRGTIMAEQSVQFEASLSPYRNDTPTYPTDLEPGAYTFDGWYYDQYFQKPVNWDEDTMPSADQIVYAKWVPVTHQVTILDKEGGTQIGETQTVVHGELAAEPEEPTNGNYTFVGWFYRDDNGAEVPFDFSIPVRRDLTLYAKWSSNQLVEYTIHYQLEDGTPIASDTNGSALAGTTKTFNAKAGSDLYSDYREGYFPKTSSHSVLMNIEGENEFTFEYVAKESVDYTVRYLTKEKPEDGVNYTEITEGDNVYYQLHAPKTVTTKNAIVTEHFETIRGYMPDAYQKRLILSATESENVLTFWYTADDEHAPVHIVHYEQNISGDGYTQIQESTDLNRKIGEKVTEEPLDLDGFTYVPSKSTSEGTVTEDGLELRLYYDRIEYPYEFRFVDRATGETLADPVSGKARYEAQVTQNAKSIPGYTVEQSSMAIRIAVDEDASGNVLEQAVKNVYTFYYNEQMAAIQYKAVGPEGTTDFGSLDVTAETVKVKTGTPRGSTPTAADGFQFVGWYTDEACTSPVSGTDGAVDGSTNHFTPAKKDTAPNDLYHAATYYAKFEQVSGTLTIEKTVSGSEAVEQDFLFTVTGPGGTYTVVIGKENFENSRTASTTIRDLPAGQYTVTEDTGWSWKYTCASSTQQASVAGGKTAEVSFTNTKSSNWLGGSDKADNIFNKVNTASAAGVKEFFRMLTGTQEEGV